MSNVHVPLKFETSCKYLLMGYILLVPLKYISFKYKVCFWDNETKFDQLLFFRYISEIFAIIVNSFTRAVSHRVTGLQPPFFSLSFFVFLLNFWVIQYGTGLSGWEFLIFFPVVS